MTFGEDVATKMSQRTLILILGTALAVGAAYADLKSDAKNDHKTIESMVAARAFDHDLLVKVAAGVDQLQRKAERDERRSGWSANTHP